MINKVILVGNLGNDPEIRNLENGGKLASFSMATNESYLDKSGQWQTITEWHNIKAWGKLADRAESALHKGSMIFLEGKLTHRQYTDKNGIERYITDVRAAVIKVINRSKDAQTGLEIDSKSDNSLSGISEMGKEAPKEIETTEDDLPF